MKIVAENDNQLVLFERPWFLAAIMTMFISGVVYALATDWTGLSRSEKLLLPFLLIVMLFVLRNFVHWVRVEFDRLSGRINISRRGFLFQRRQNFAIDHLDRAVVEQRSDEGVTYRVVLVFKEAIFSEMSTDEREQRETARRRGFRSAAANEVPLTSYFSGSMRAKEIGAAINRWIGRDE